MNQEVEAAIMTIEMWIAEGEYGNSVEMLGEGGGQE